MNCTCLKDIENKLLEAKPYPSMQSKKVEMIGIQSCLTFGGLGVRTFSEVEITLQGQSKKPVEKIFHNYCPFCGVDQSKKIEN